MTTTQRLAAIKSAFANPDANKAHVRLQAQQIGTCASRIADLAGNRSANVNFEAEIKVLETRCKALIDAAREVG